MPPYPLHGELHACKFTPMARPRIHPERTVVKTSFAVHAEDLEFLDELRADGQSRSEVLRQIIDRTREDQPAA